MDSEWQKTWPAQVISGSTAFQPAVFICDDAGIAHFTSGSCDGKDHTNWKTGFWSFGAEEKVPYIGFRICKAVTDGFTGINNTSASYSKKKIHIFSAAELNSLPDLGKPWIWNDASKSYIGNSCLVKYGSDFINKTGFNGTVSAVVDQKLFYNAVLSEVWQL